MKLSRRNFLFITGAAAILPSGAVASTPKIVYDPLAIQLRKLTRDIIRFSMYEMNDPFTRHKQIAMAREFLQPLKAKRILYDYRIVCDETNNTPALIDSNGFRFETLVRHVRSMNYIHTMGEVTPNGITISQTE